ncbi:MAG: hypothetical protein H6617_04385 [Bdellovibrionaceae bacterium]|nr:hypothetical protein [Bdellovibrionales bacterium]MCB9253898.1 hypothetical protein [Pseudobdellovibrionaceae bacterium]
MKWFGFGAATILSLILVSLFGLRLGAAGVEGKQEEEYQQLHRLRKSLQTRERALLGRENVVEKKEKDLKEKEQVLQVQIARYEKIIKDLNAKLAKARKYEEERVAALKSIYERMEPKRAAKVLNKMDTDSVASLLADMRKEQAAEILGRMTSNHAKEVSEKLLQRTLSSTSN